MTEEKTSDLADDALREKRWLRLKPVKAGWLGMEWKHFEREITMAFEEGVERGVLDRRYEFLFEDDVGLPQSTAHEGIEAFNRLVDAGWLAVVSANYTDAAAALAEHANAPYDMAAIVVEAMHRAPILTPHGVKEASNGSGSCPR